MRIFIVVGHTVTTAPDFGLNDLCSGTGRLDVMLRCVNSAFFLSHEIRKDTELFLVFQGPPEPPKTLRFVGAELRYLNPDERSTAALVRNALLKYKKCGEQWEWLRSTPGTYISRKSLAEVLTTVTEKCKLIYLKETGTDIRNHNFGSDTAFILSDQHDFTAAEEEFIKKIASFELSVGPKSLHSDHCITIVHNELDRRLQT